MNHATTGVPAQGGDAQRAVIDFLREAGSHAGAVRVDVIETHGNLVFLAGSNAWKIKRAVKFAYMDFSTLELRHAACLHEMEVNARLAPELYLGVVAITRDADGNLSLGGSGTPVEWAVRMRRFEQGDLLSSQAREGRLSGELAKAVADTVLASHAGAAAARGSGSARMANVMGPLFDALARCSALEAAKVCGLQEAAARALQSCRVLLDRRAAEGRVRRCHGDLHCANIVLWQGKPVLYDAIEFDDELATIDTLYDLAFLLMDLERLGQPSAANVVLNRYLWRSNDDLDIEGLRCLPLFLALRAAIRALVTGERGEQRGAREAGHDRRRAEAFLSLARAYLRPPAPRLVAVGGLSGTGKSTLAAAIAPDLGIGPGALHLRSDLERKSLLGVGETERLPAGAYTREAAQRVYENVARKAGLALAAGWSVVADAVSARPEERQMLATVAVEAGAAFQGLWLTAPAQVLRARVAARRGDASDADEAVVATQLTWDTGDVGAEWQTLDASGTMVQTLAAARGALALPAHPRDTDIEP